MTKVQKTPPPSWSAKRYGCLRREGMQMMSLVNSLGWEKHGGKDEMMRWKSVLFLLVDLVMFGFEIFYAIRLDLVPGDSATLHDLAILLVLIYVYGIARAWDLVGVRQFHLQVVL